MHSSYPEKRNFSGTFASPLTLSEAASPAVDVEAGPMGPRPIVAANFSFVADTEPGFTGLAVELFYKADTR